MILLVPRVAAAHVPAASVPQNAILDCSDIIDCMASIVIRNLDEGTKRKLKIRAAMNGRSMEQEAAMGFLEKPVWADLKFNWSHAHSTTKLIKVHGGKLYDTYFKPEPTLYKIVWTARNEDFFCLRWGVPSFVRNHILQNRRSYSGGRWRPAPQ